VKNAFKLLRVKTCKYLIHSSIRYILRMKTPRYGVFKSNTLSMPIFSTNWQFLVLCQDFHKNYGRVENWSEIATRQF
jgi:hypothetical protein